MKNLQMKNKYLILLLLNVYNLKTWDDNILDISKKELIGYYIEDKILFLDEL